MKNIRQLGLRVLKRLGRTLSNATRSHSVRPAPCNSHQAGLQLPSPWIGRFDCEADFAAAMSSAQGLINIYSHIDDQMVASRHPLQFPAFCAACGSTQTMRIDWHFAGVSAGGSVNPAWTETGVCGNCTLNSRMRSVIDFIATHPDYSPEHSCYLAERVTVSYPEFVRRFASLETSEYLGPDRQPGEVVFVARHATSIRHEDLTRLSFADGQFNWVVTQDVFEHIPDYPAAFRECARVLSPGGWLVFTVPFDSSLSQTRVRAQITGDGGIEHLHPPEIHGNPTTGEGALCFQNFGWDLLDTLRASGFSQASAHAYWGPWQGHVGVGAFVFAARK